MRDPSDFALLAVVAGVQINGRFRRIRDIESLFVGIVERPDQLPRHDKAEMSAQVGGGTKLL